MAPDGDRQRHPLRVRTVTAFLRLSADPAEWEPEVAAAGAFLAHARSHLESLGYEVQTTRVATQPFGEYLAGGAAGGTGSGGTDGGSNDDALVANAVRLEALAARHGVTLVSLGSSSDPAHLAALPRLLASTRATSATFSLPADAGWPLARAVAEAVMEVARLTGGLGNFRFGSASNMAPGVPYFPVATCGPDQHRCFAIGTESDALLHAALSSAAAAAAAWAAEQPAGAEPASGGQQHLGQHVDVLQAARRLLPEVLLQHLAPLEAAALHVEATAPPPPPHSSSSSSSLAHPEQRFRYLGLDSSLAPGLDTPPLTDSYGLLLRHLQQQRRCQGGAAGGGPPQAASGGLQLGAPGSLALSSLITQALKGLPLRLTGYCGLMLAVCEDQGLAAAAAAGSITVSQLLQYSAVCGCGLDTVPVPGPATAAAATGDRDGVEAAAAADRDTTAAIAGLISDVNALAHRLGKPLACRLLPLPGKVAGDETDFSHPYLINSRVMDLHT